MGQKPKPNFKPYGNKKPQKSALDSALGALFTPSKKQTPKTHHDTIKGNKGNGGGKRR